jgi:DNA-binding NarL/FixJ family response regulator
MQILIADQNRSFRAEFVELITQLHTNWQIAEVDDAVELRAQMLASRYDIVFLDLALPGVGAFVNIAGLREEYPSTKFVGIGEHNDTATVIRCFEGAMGGYVARDSAGIKLIRTLQVIGHLIGMPELFVSTGTAMVTRTQPSAPARPALREPDAAPHALTARQADVLKLLAEGRSTKDIARRLGLAVPTVKTHLAAVYRQLGAQNRLQAVVKASALASPPRPAPAPMRPVAPSPMFERHFAAG